MMSLKIHKWLSTFAIALKFNFINNFLIKKFSKIEFLASKVVARN